MSSGDINYNRLNANRSLENIVDGRLDLVDSTHIKWGFQNSNQILLNNGSSWELVRCTTEPTLANTATDLNGTALAVDKIYDVFAEYSSSTAFALKCSRWVTVGTGGNSARLAAYAAGTTYAIGDRVTYGGHDWVKISSAAAGTTPVAGAAWVDNGTSVSGDFAGLYRHDGVLVSDSSATGKKRRWLGIVYTYNNGGTVNFKDELTYRYISNYYNNLTKYGEFYNTTGSWTYNTDTPRESNSGTGQIRLYFLTCNASQSILVSRYQRAAHVGLVYVMIGIGLNTTSVFYASNVSSNVADVCLTNGESSQTVVTGVIPSCGMNYLTCIERTEAGTTATFFGDNYCCGKAFISC